MTRQSWDRLRVILAVLGLLVAGYLTLLHYDTSVPLACSDTGVVDCAAVLSSPYAMLLGLPVALWGVGWFTVALGLGLGALARARGPEPPALRWAGLLWSVVGGLFVAYLVSSELMIGKMCLWCTGVHVLVLAILVILVLSDPTRLEA